MKLSHQDQRLIIRNGFTMAARFKDGLLALRPDASINLQCQSPVYGIEQIADVIFDVPCVDVFPPKVPGVNDFEEVVEQLDDGRLVGKGSCGKMFELRAQLSKCPDNLTGDRSNVVPLPLFAHYGCQVSRCFCTSAMN